MIERRDDGSDVMIDDPTMNRIDQAMKDKAVKQIHLYKPGEIVTLRTARYKVGPKGNWIRISDDIS